MTSHARPPPSLLEPYLRLPPETSLILLTSTLGCSVNWLVARYIASFLSLHKIPSRSTEQLDGLNMKEPLPSPLPHSRPPPPIILVSWLRDVAFWKAEIRRTTGIDISRAPYSQQPSTSPSSNPFTFIDHTTTTLPTLSCLQSHLSSTLSSSRTKPILILDHPSILLFTHPHDALTTFILHLRSLSHALVLTCPADSPLLLLPASSSPTPLDRASAAFSIAQAHCARWILSVRELETGAARDVSGVVRVTRGGGWYDHDDDDDEEEENEMGAAAAAAAAVPVLEEREMLYLVQRDGTVKVFGRGDGEG